jgi:aminopeptidase N
MKDLLGDVKFKKCLQEYMKRWNGKHPIPWDFFYTFNDVSRKNLNWFWSNWFFSNNYIDLAINGVKKDRMGNEISIQNIGGMYVPFDLIIKYTDGTGDKIHETPVIWKPDLKVVTVKTEGKKKIQTVKIDNGIFLDADQSDNVWELK